MLAWRVGQVVAANLRTGVRKSLVRGVQQSTILKSRRYGKMPTSLPAPYEEHVSKLEEEVPEGESTLNVMNSWISPYGEHRKAAVLCLKHYLGAPELNPAQAKVFKARWAEAVSGHVEDPIDTCLGKTPEGLQCSKKARVQAAGCAARTKIRTC